MTHKTTSKLALCLLAVLASSVSSSSSVFDFESFDRILRSDPDRILASALGCERDRGADSLRHTRAPSPRPVQDPPVLLRHPALRDPRALLGGEKALERHPLKCPNGCELKLRTTANTPLSNEGTLFAKAREFVVDQDHCDICDQLIRGRCRGHDVLAYKCDCSDCDFAVCHDCYTCYKRLAHYAPSIQELQNEFPISINEFLASPQKEHDILTFIRNQYRSEFFQTFIPEELCGGWEKMSVHMYTTIDSSDSSLTWHINDFINKHSSLLSTLTFGLEKLRGKRRWGESSRWVQSSEILHIIERRFAFFWHTLLGSSHDERHAAVEECQCKPDKVSGNHVWVKRPLGLSSPFPLYGR